MSKKENPEAGTAVCSFASLTGVDQMFFSVLSTFQILELWSTITANQSFIRFHGRNTKGHYWYNYLYSEQELKPWVEKVNEIREQTKILRIYFNNHYGGKAVVNAMQFKEMIGLSLSADEKRVMENAKGHILGN
jgi:uncharacterized protein YecE (DUF72 family)